MDDLMARIEAHIRGLQQEGDTTSQTRSYDCPLCHDSGWVDAGNRSVTRCSCVAVKAARHRLEASGLLPVLDRLTFETYIASETWQQKNLATVRKWVEEVKGGGHPWLYCGGAVGSGKTHLCTAACGALLKEDKAVRYMLWSDEARLLKSLVNDEEEYYRKIQPLKTCDVLYIDDLFKVQRGDQQGRITPADIRLAFELIDARYRNERTTVISCEWLMDELLGLDEGVSSRIYERSRGYRVQIAREAGRNMRLAFQ